MVALVEGRRMVVIEEFTAVHRNTLRGFARVMLVSGLSVADVALHVSDGKAWASPPSKPMLDRDGQAIRDVTGKIRYVPIIAFATKQHRDRFSELVVEAVREAYPRALS